MAKFNKLDVPYQWKDEFTKYPHGYTIFEALCKWVKQVDNMVDNINNWNDYLDNFVENFEFELQEEVQSTITRWQNEGLLDDIIASALNTELDNVKAQLAEIIHSRFIKVVDPSMTQTEIQNVLNEGGNIYFSKGLYEVEILEDDVAFYVSSNSKIELDKEAIVKLLPTSKERYYIFLCDEIENFEITGGKIIGDREEHLGSTGEWGQGIRLQASRNGVIRDIHISNCWGDGITIGGKYDNSKPSENIHVLNNVIDNNRRLGIAVTNCLGGSIQNNVIKNTNGTNPQAGIDIEPDRYGVVYDMVISGNDIFDNVNEGILISIRSSLVGDTFIERNIIENNRIYRNSVGISIGSDTKDHVISNNQVFNNRNHGIVVASNGNVISNNIVQRNNAAGINVYSSTNNSITGNTIKNNTQAGVILQEGSDFNSISKNVIVENRLGVHLLRSSDNLIYGNTFQNNGSETSDASSGVNIISSSRRNYVTNNVFESGDLQKYGVRVADNTSSSNIVSYNDLRNGGTIEDLVSGGASILTGAGNFFLSGFSTEYGSL